MKKPTVLQDLGNTLVYYVAKKGQKKSTLDRVLAKAKADECSPEVAAKAQGVRTYQAPKAFSKEAFVKGLDGLPGDYDAWQADLALMFNKASAESIKGKARKAKVEEALTPEVMAKLADYMNEHQCKAGAAAEALKIMLPW